MKALDSTKHKAGEPSMNTKKCCCRLALVVLSFVVFSVGNATTSFHGVIKPNGRSVLVDSAYVTAPPQFDTFATPGWMSDSVAIDTFDFPDLGTWPVLVTLLANINGIRVPFMFPSPARDSWYNFMPVPPPPPFPQVMFYGTTGVEESRSAVEPESRLNVSPSVVTTQMTVRLQRPGPGRPVVEVFDAAGNLIRSLDCTAGANGLAMATWHREDGLGHLVPAGIYFCRYAASGDVAVRKVLVAH
jgi:hypothetical protein